MGHAKELSMDRLTDKHVTQKEQQDTRKPCCKSEQMVSVLQSKVV